MMPFDAPANHNEPPAGPVAIWAVWPLAVCAVSLTVFARQCEVWGAAHRSLAQAASRLWDAGADETPPLMAMATADVREASAAVWRAQMDVVDALRRSA